MAKALDRSFLLRLHGDQLDLLKMLAHWHGRSTSEEMRAALRLGGAASMAALLQDPAFIAELQADRPEIDVDDLRKQVEEDRRLVERHDYGTRPPWYARYTNLIQT